MVQEPMETDTAEVKPPEEMTILVSPNPCAWASSMTCSILQGSPTA